MKHTVREDAALAGSLVDAAPIGIYVLDSGLRVLHANDAARRVFGRFAAGLVGRELGPVLAGLWGADAAAMSIDAFRTTLETGEPFASEEFSARRLDTGRTDYYEWSVVRIALPGGEYGAACYFRDITSKVEARKSIEESCDALQLADARKDEFLATLAHELRNPLAPLSNCLHILRLRDTDDAEGKRMRGIMERQLATLVRMTDDLLEVSRITRGKIELRRAPCDLRDIVRAALETSRPLIARAHHDLDVHVDALEPLPVFADGVRLSQVFSNLLNNAAKYTPARGRITVELAREEGNARVSIRDNGIGLAADRLERVFELFFQETRGRRLSQGGLGIGLTLVRSLVSMHGGTVAALSEGEDRGSEFIVLLPLLSGETPHMAPVLATFDGEPLDIVVADDNPENADSLAQMLRMAGHRVRVAYGGEACLALLEDEQPDLVLLDLGMPGLDGFDTCRAIRERHGRELRVLAVTGFGQMRDVAESAKAGFDGHIVKPVDPAKLAEGMAGLARRKHA